MVQVRTGWTYLKNIIVKKDHYDTWNVERRKTRVDYEVAIIKETSICNSIWRVI